MIYVLFILLLMMLFIAYIINGKDILSPWVITIGMFLISTFFALINVGNWDFELSSLVVIVIISGLLAYGLGELLVNGLVEKYLPPKVTGKGIKRINISYHLAGVITMLMILGGVYVFYKTYEMSVLAGNTSGLSRMLEYTRTLYIQPGYSLGRGSIHISLIGKALSAIFLYVFLNNLLSDNRKKGDILYMGPVLVYLGIALLGTGRTFMIEFLAMVLIFYFILDRKRSNWGNKEIGKIVVFGCMALLLFFALFFLLGYITGKSQGAKVFDMISTYTGLSIPSLDFYLNKSKDVTVNLGEETLYGVLSVLRRLGLAFDETIRHLEFVKFNNTQGNVYTSLRRYINDYGFVGMLVIQTYIGIFYTTIYNIIKREKGFGICLIFYGFLAYPLFMQGIDELLLSSYLSTSFVYLILYTLLFYFLLIGRKDIGKKYEFKN